MVIVKMRVFRRFMLILFSYWVRGAWRIRGAVVVHRCRGSTRFFWNFQFVGNDEASDKSRLVVVEHGSVGRKPRSVSVKSRFSFVERPKTNKLCRTVKNCGTRVSSDVSMFLKMIKK